MTLPPHASADGLAASRAAPGTLLLALCAIAGYWLVLIYHLGAQWSVYDQYNYGWAVPFLCLYLLWQSAKRKAQGAECEAVGGKQGTGTSPWSSPLTRRRGDVLCAGVFALCALLYAPTRFLHEANPVWRLTSLLWTLEVIGLTLLIIRFALGARRLAQFIFPTCFFLVAVPWPSGLETFLTQLLMRLNVTTTVELLSGLGVPAIQHGTVIEIATGNVGIDEACSGIRSLQATLMISLFFGELYALSTWRRALCVFAGFAFAFIFNVGRTLLLTWVASAKGIGAVASWHDPAGVTILVGCFLCLWTLAVLLGGKAQSVAQDPDFPIQSSPFDVQGSSFNIAPASPHLPPSIFHLRRLTWSSGFVVPLSLLAWLLLVETGTEIWYRHHERSAAGISEWSVDLDVAEPAVTKVNIPPNIRGQFQADQSLQARWRDRSSNSWQLYYFRWLPAHSLKKRVAIQLAKTHGPEMCLPAAGMKLTANLGIIMVPIAGVELAMQQYVFSAEGTVFHVFYGIYEDQSGSAVLANRRNDAKSRVAAALAGSRNCGQRFLEVAVVGYQRPEEARAALTGELGNMIRMGK